MTEAFLKRHGFEHGRVIIEYGDVWVLLGHEEGVYWKGIRCDVPGLMALSTRLLMDPKIVAEVYNDHELKLKINTFTPEMQSLLVQLPSDGKTIVESILEKNRCSQIFVHFGSTAVIFKSKGAQFQTKWKTIESKVMEERAIDVLRYPGVKGRALDSECVVVRNTVDVNGNVIAEAIQDQIRDQRVLAFLKRHNRNAIQINYTPYGFHVLLTPDKYSLTYKNVEYTEHELIDDAIQRIELSLDMQKETKLLVHTVSNLNLSVRVRQAAEKLLRSTAVFKYYFVDDIHQEKMIDVLIEYDRFSIHDNKFGVGFNNRDEQREFEDKYATEINLYTDYITEFDGGNNVFVERITNINKVTFTALHGAVYYFKLEEIDKDKTRISISGEPSMIHPAIQAYFFPKTNHIDIYDFFLFNNMSKRHIQSDYGHSARGMLLVKFIALFLAVDIVTIDDNWKYRRGEDVINSEKFSVILKWLADKLPPSQQALYDRNKQSIDKWCLFFTLKGTYANAIEYGYFGGFGFTTHHPGRAESPELYAPEFEVPWHDYGLRGKKNAKSARVNEIACA